MADQLGAMIYEQRWAELPVLLAKLAPHFRDIRVKRMTRSESVWQGAYEKLMGG